MGSVGAARADDAQGVASSRMSYSRFLEYLDMGRVKKVNPFTNSFRHILHQLFASDFSFYNCIYHEVIIDLYFQWPSL